MSDYIKADVWVMTVFENGLERTVKTWAHRRPTADEPEARKICAHKLRARLIARVRKQIMSGGINA